MAGRVQTGNPIFFSWNPVESASFFVESGGICVDPPRFFAVIRWIMPLFFGIRGHIEKHIFSHEIKGIVFFPGIS